MTTKATPELDGRRAIARLAAVVITADGHLTRPEMDALVVLDGLGLGSLVRLVDDEIPRVVQDGVDLAATCRPLEKASPSAVSLLVATLAELAAADGDLVQRERDVLMAIARRLGLPAVEANALLAEVGNGPAAHDDAATATPPRTTSAPPSHASAAAPPTGPEFVALAVHKLADATAAWETAMAASDVSGSR